MSIWKSSSDEVIDGVGEGGSTEHGEYESGSATMDDGGEFTSSTLEAELPEKRRSEESELNDGVRDRGDEGGELGPNDSAEDRGEDILVADLDTHDTLSVAGIRLASRAISSCL